MYQPKPAPSYQRPAYVVPEPAYKPTPAPAYKPAPVPAYKPVPAPAYKPAPSYQRPAYVTPEPAYKPVYEPVPKPAYEPVPKPAYKPAPVSAYKSGGMGNEEFQNGISGFYKIDHNVHSDGDQNDWYNVKITWNPAKGAFTWRNRAGVTWTLTPMMGPSDSWDRTKLAVGNDSPYKNDGHMFAKIEWVS